MNRLLTGLVAWWVIAGALGAQAQSPDRFRFSKVLERSTSPEEEIVAFTVDSDIDDATRLDFPDLRVYDETQAEAPYQLEPDVEFRDEKTRQSLDTHVESLREVGGGIEVQLRVPQRSQGAIGMRIETPQVDYERKVQVFGSKDGKEWQSLAEAIIFDFSRYMDVSNREFTLPANDFRNFKLVISDVTDDKESPYKELTRTFSGGKEGQRTERTMIERRTLHIDRVSAWHEVVQHVRKEKTATYDVSGLEVAQDAAQKQTIVSIRTHRQPTTSFTLQTPSRNFYRRAVVEVPVVHAAQTDWVQIGEATISNFTFRNHHHQQLTVGFPERRESKYRIVIHNEDNPPLNITGVQAQGNVYRVVFLAQPAKSYRVYYGSETADAPKYETAVVLASLGREDFQPVVGKLGPQVENAGFGGEPGFGARKLLNNWVFLGGVLGIMVVVLGWSLFRAGRRISDLPQQE